MPPFGIFDLPAEHQRRELQRRELHALQLQQRRKRLESAARQLTLLIRRELAAFKPSARLDASAHARRAQEVASLQGHDNPQFHDPVSGKLRRARDLAASTVFDALAAQLPSVSADLRLGEEAHN